MMLLIQAEWLRFRCQRSNLLVLALLLALLCVSAWFAGQAAAAHRQLEQARTTAWQAHLRSAQAAIQQDADAYESAEAAKKAYEFGRGKAPAALRPAPGGLVLAIQQYRQQPYDVQVSLDSRHLDPRRSAPLANPLLDSFGAPDFAVAMALLVPLAVIALSYGLVHDARELGTWSLLRAQLGTPWLLLAVGLALRLLAILLVAALASALAFGLDPGAAWTDCLRWLGATALYVLVWIAIAGLLNLTQLSSAASALCLLALFLVLNAVTPAWLALHAAQRVPLPAREDLVVQARAIQHAADERTQELVEAWYAHHPAQRPVSVSSHTWPVSYVPKTVWQDIRIGRLFGAVDRARAEQAALLDPWLWAAPGLALCRSADRLAGADPAQYLRYARQVEALEAQWRAVLAPAVMSYRGLDAQRLEQLNRLSPIEP